MASGCFDLLAADYDRAWTNSGAGRLQRDGVWRHMMPLFRSGNLVLDLGCGTGEDAQHLLGHGVRVLALDASSQMVQIARSRGVNAQVKAIEDIYDLDGTFDGIISNFGAFNCVPDIRQLRTSLVRLLRPGGYFVVCLMGRFCLAESLHFLWRCQFRKAARRWSGRTHVQTLDLRVAYPTAGQMTMALGPEFRLVRRIGIGLAVPPSYIAGLSRKSLEIRDRIDTRLGHWPFLRSLADHQLFIFVRK